MSTAAGSPVLTRALQPALPMCSECGHALPPEDPTDAQVDRFLDDDSNRDCETCSELWLRLIVRMAAGILAERLDA